MGFHINVYNMPRIDNYDEAKKEFETKLTEKESEFTAYKTKIERRAIVEAVQAKASLAEYAKFMETVQGVNL